MSLAFDSLLVLVLVALVVLWRYSKTPTSRLPLPPGPKPLPIIGNLLDMPLERLWLTYDRWFKQYGDIVHINILGQPVILLGSAARTVDIFEKRSSLYSDRPRFVMANELMGWDFNFGFVGYGSWWRSQRKLFNEYFRPKAIAKYYPSQLREVRRFLRRLLATPDEFLYHIRYNYTATSMDIVYGIKLLDTNDPYVPIIEESLDGLAQAGVPGTFLVDVMPFLKYVPAWVPGAGFKKKAAHWAEVNTQFIEGPFNTVKDALIQGTAVPSVAVSLLESLPDDELRPEKEKMAQYIAAVGFGGGADTAVSAIQSFFLAMAINPEAQKKAQAELDTVVGPDRLPDFGDRESLPYIWATVMETLRWQTITPLAVPHASIADDEYDGYFIPKGAIIFGNAWSVLHDPEMYPDPDKFNPDRFLKDGKPNPDVREPMVAFGFGRRMCPGRYLTQNSIFIIISSVLSVYDIRPPVDNQGNDIQLKPEMTSGLLSYPVPFKCIVRPRSSAAEKLIRESDLL